MAPGLIAFFGLWGSCGFAVWRGLIQSRWSAFKWGFGLQLASGLLASFVGYDNDYGFAVAVVAFTGVLWLILRSRSTQWRAFLNQYGLTKDAWIRPRWSGHREGARVTVRWMRRGVFPRAHRLRVTMADDAFRGLEIVDGSGRNKTGDPDFDRRYALRGDDLGLVMVAVPALRELMLAQERDGIPKRAAEVVAGELRLFRTRREPFLAEEALEALNYVIHEVRARAEGLLARLACENDPRVRVRLAELVVQRHETGALDAYAFADEFEAFIGDAAALGQPDLTIVVAPWLPDGIERLGNLAVQGMPSTQSAALVRLTELFKSRPGLTLPAPLVEYVQRLRQAPSTMVARAAVKLLQEAGILKTGGLGGMMLVADEGPAEGALQLAVEGEDSQGALQLVEGEDPEHALQSAEERDEAVIES